MPANYALQLYTARDTMAWDKAIPLLAKLGYAEVEGWGALFPEAEKVRKVMDKNGMTMPTAHVSLDMLEKEKKKTLGIASTLGVSRLIAPWVHPNERPTTAKGWKEFGKRLGGVAETYRDEGYPVAWHNHDFEFVELKDGTTPHEHMFDAAPLLDWEIDVAWVQRAKTNPVKWIKKYAGNIVAIHIKDIAKRGENQDEDGWADVGFGTMDWGKIFAAIADTRCVHFVVEHDKPSDFERFARRSFASLKKY